MLYVKKDIILVCSILSVIVLLITSINYLPITTFDIDWESSRFSTQKKTSLLIKRCFAKTISSKYESISLYFTTVSVLLLKFFLQNKIELVSIHYDEYINYNKFIKSTIEIKSNMIFHI